MDISSPDSVVTMDSDRSLNRFLCILIVLFAAPIRTMQVYAFSFHGPPARMIGDTFLGRPSRSQLDASVSSVLTDPVTFAPAIQLDTVAYTGLYEEEFQMVGKVIEAACYEAIGIPVTCNTTSLQWSSTSPTRSVRIPGALGRVLLVRTDLDEDSMQAIESSISEQLDELLYSDPPKMVQPVLVRLRNPNVHHFPVLSNQNVEDVLLATIEQEFDEYGLQEPIKGTLQIGTKRRKLNEVLAPSLHVELDAAQVTDDSSGATWRDTSTVLVFDNLVSDELRRGLLELTLGRSSSDWDDIQDGPDPRRWVRGGLADVPSQDEGGDDHRFPKTPSCWGLRDEAVEEICFQQHHAIGEFEGILSEIFPQFLVSRLPEAVFGACVSPMTANAPTHGDQFNYHIDGDPNLTPPSPWTDIYGRYPNRSSGKPRFMSCLVYLSDEWNADQWGAPTRFLDIPTGRFYDVLPKPGRCVIMDQDVSHAVVAPKAASGKRPRYSLVWKLILHGNEDFQDMRELASDRSWPTPMLFGSAESA